jgi:hypothetical protein
MHYEIKRVLEDLELEPPILFEKFMEKLQKLLAKVCREFKYELDPFYDARFWYLDEPGGKVVYILRKHRDTLYCNGRKYYVIAHYWILEVHGTRVITKYKLIDVEHA